MAREFSRKFYGSLAWKECRASFILSKNGLCERCLSNDKYVPGVIVHHKEKLTPVNINDPNVTLNWEKLEYLCMDCHNREHGRSATAEGTMFDSKGDLVEI